MEKLNLYGRSFTSRFILGSAGYPSPEILKQSLRAAGAEIFTVSLRRETAAENSSGRFWDYLKDLKLHVLPNTAGCLSVKEAVTTAHMARDLFDTPWIKLEVIGNDDLLVPDPFGTVEAARILLKDGFEVFPYITHDLVVCGKLAELGCKVIMPWGSLIGSGRGLDNIDALRILREKLAGVTLIVDAGLGKPSHAAQAMELGFDAVLLNTAVARSIRPEDMAKAFALAVKAGRIGYEAGMIAAQNRATPSSPTVGVPFWHQREIL
jgi:thiazole synthase